MKIMKYKLRIIGLFLIIGTQICAQNDTTGTFPPPLDNQVKFKLSGYTFFNFEIPEAGTGSFTKAVFAPIFTWRVTDKLFFQSEIEFGSDGGNYDGGFEMEFATLNYLLNKHFTLYAGKFLGPLGTFQTRYHPAWINKSINQPIGLGNEINGLKRLQAGSEAGVGIKGGSQIGSSKINYDIYIANGAIMDTTSGKLEMESLDDNNQNKAIGGRIGLFPFSNSSLEVGVSGYMSNVGDKGTSYESTKVSIIAVDLNFIKSTGIGIIDIKGEFQQRTVDAVTYFSGPTDTIGFTYNNNPSVMYAQLAYRLPSIGSMDWIRKIELVGRYASMSVDELSPIGANVTDLTVGLNYWINFNTVFKIGYDIVTFDDELMDVQPNNLLTFQAAMGF